MMYFRLQDLIAALNDRLKDLTELHSKDTMGDYEYTIRSSELKHTVSYIQLIIDELEAANKMIKPGAKSE